MATQQPAVPTNGATPQGTREWQEFAYIAFARIVMRKHDILVPEIGDLSRLSNEELDKRLRLISELAHLPPA